MDLMTEGGGEEIHLEHVSSECSRNISWDGYIWVTSLHCGIKFGGRAVTIVMVNLHRLLLFSWIQMDPETRAWVQGVSLGLILGGWGVATGGPRGQESTAQSRLMEGWEGGLWPHRLKFAPLPFPWAEPGLPLNLNYWLVMNKF